MDIELSSEIAVRLYHYDHYINQYTLLHILPLDFYFVQVIRLEDELVVTKEKLQKQEEENVKLKETIPNLEKMISERDAQIDYLTTVRRHEWQSTP